MNNEGTVAVGRAGVRFERVEKGYGRGAFPSVAGECGTDDGGDDGDVGGEAVATVEVGETCCGYGGREEIGETWDGELRVAQGRRKWGSLPSMATDRVLAQLELRLKGMGGVIRKKLVEEG